MKEEDTGRIPLPAVESIVWAEERQPSLSVIAPDVLPGCQVVFVDPDAMSVEDRLRLAGSLRLLEDQIQRLTGRSSGITAIWHRGGLDYDFTFEDGPAVGLDELEWQSRPLVWVLLQELAGLGARYPDRPASTPVGVGGDRPDEVEDPAG